MTDKVRKFTDQARLAMQFAREEADLLRHNYVGNCHMLLGLLRAQDGVANGILRQSGVELDKARETVAAILGTEPGEQGLTDRAREAFVIAVKISRLWSQQNVGTEHILLGILQLPDAEVDQVLKLLGANGEEIRVQTVTALANMRDKSILRHNNFTRYTVNAQKVWELAQVEAQSSDTAKITTGHVLLAILCEDSGEAAQLLSSLGITLAGARESLALVDAEELENTGEIPAGGSVKEMTFAAKQLFRKARAISEELEHENVGVKHIVLAMIDDMESAGAKVLVQMGTTLDKVRAQILETFRIMPQTEPTKSRVTLRGSLAELVDEITRPGKPASRVRPKHVGNSTLISEEARTALQFAREEARSLYHNNIGTEHILLGLLHSSDSLAARVLHDLGVGLDDARKAVISITSVGDNLIVEEIGFTPRAQRVLERALEEAHDLSHRYIGAEHLLLGLQREGEGIAAGVLEFLGVSLEQLRFVTIALLNDASKQETLSKARITEEAILDAFDPRAEQPAMTLKIAREEARRYHHRSVNTEHILLALISQHDSRAFDIISSMEVKADKIRSEVESLVAQGKPDTQGEIYIVPRVKRAFDLAREEAHKLKADQFDTEHILLGLVREDDGIAAGVLERLGVTLERVRNEVITRLNSPAGPQATRPDNMRFHIRQLEKAVERMWLGMLEREKQDPNASRYTYTMITGDVGLNPRVRDMLTAAMAEARRLGDEYLGTEHILLALLREDANNAGKSNFINALEKLGVNPNQLHSEYTKMQEESREEINMAENKLDDAEGIISPGQQMTLSLPILRTQFDYLIWARDQLLPLIEGLTDEDRKKSDSRGVYGSIHDTLAHMAQSEWLWIQRCLGESPLRLPKGEDFPSLTALISWWNDVHAEAILYLDSITEEDLQAEITYLAPDGIRRTRKAWHMLVQVPNHQTEHRSQIATMLGAMGHEVPPTDMVVYLSKTNA